MLFKQKGGGKYGILMRPKKKLPQALFTLNYLDLQLNHTRPAATLHFQNTILSENYTPGQMIADNTPVWWENVMDNWCKGLRLQKGRGYALVIADDGQHHRIPGRHVTERKAEGIVRQLSSRGAARDGDNKADNRQPS